jgi:hypothetical protein
MQLLLHDTEVCSLARLCAGQWRLGALPRRPQELLLLLAVHFQMHALLLVLLVAFGA